MQCIQCGHSNQSGKFCVKCGANMEAATASEVMNPSPLQPLDLNKSAQSARPAQSAQRIEPNAQLQQVKQMSSQYFAYFIQVLKNPVLTGQTSNAGHMANGLITMILFSLILPFIAYFQLKESLNRYGGFLGDQIDVPFGAVVIKPFFFLFIVVIMVNSIIFLVLKMGNVAVNYREITARFGTFMIPSATLLFAGLLLSFIGLDNELLAWIIGAGIFSWFVAICFTIYSFKKDHTSGLDAFYAVIITYAGSILLLYLFGDNLLASLLEGLGDL